MVSLTIYNAFLTLFDLLLSTDAKNQFTYWSQRAFNRPGNKGIRLDYFICSPDLFNAASNAADGAASKATASDSKQAAAGKVVSGASVAEEASGAGSGGSTVQVYDTYILHGDTVGCSDHCPVVLVLKL